MGAPGRGRPQARRPGALAFPSADKAGEFVQNSAEKWKNCANQTISTTNRAGETVKWALASLNGEPPSITLNETQVGASNNWGCQRALSAVSNVVVDVNGRMSRVPWNFGGGPVSIRLRSPDHCARRVRHVWRAVGVLGGTPDTYHTAGLKRGTATSSSTTPGTTSVNGCGYHIANEGRQLADKMVAKVKGR